MKPFRLLIVCSLFLPSAARAQESGKRVVPLEGNQAFCNILHEFNLKPIKTLEELADKKPAQTLLIVFGDTAILDDFHKRIGNLEKFREDGGAILIASDRNDRGRLQEWKLHITGGVVTEDKSLAYKGIEDCPKITKPEAGAHAIFQGVNQGLATNRPSTVQYRDSEFDLLARYSVWDRLDGIRFLGAFMVGRDRALVIAGHSVFMNVLLPQPDNDNFIFAKNCVRWLVEGKRKYALFVEDGRIVSEFDVGLTVLPPLPFPPTTVLNRLLRGLEDESFFNRLVNRFLSRDQILRTILILLTLLLLLIGCKRLLTARHRIEAAVPLLTPLPSPVPAIQLTLPGKRQQALLKGGDFREPCRDLARYFFEELAQMPALPHSLQGIAPPAYAASGGWLERRWLARHLPYLWQLAYGDPGRISKRRFASLPAILDRMTHAFQANRFRWV